MSNRSERFGENISKLCGGRDKRRLKNGARDAVTKLVSVTKDVLRELESNGVESKINRSLTIEIERGRSGYAKTSIIKKITIHTHRDYTHEGSYDTSPAVTRAGDGSDTAEQTDDVSGPLETLGPVPCGLLRCPRSPGVCLPFLLPVDVLRLSSALSVRR